MSNIFYSSRFESERVYATSLAMKALILSALFLFLFAAFPAGAKDSVPQRAKVFNAESFTLANGMQVVVIPNTRAPVVTHMVWYKVGGSNEVAGKSGLAHFLEHLMFKGSENVAPGEFSKRVRALGGNDNAFTTQDYTAYHQSIAVQHLETVMAMEADRMKSMLLPPEEFESERKVVLEERNQNTENDPRAHFVEQMRYALFPAHPYGTPVIGWKQDIESLTREDAMNFHKVWYAPNNAILVVAGDITADKLRPLTEKYYGSIPANPIPTKTFPPVNEFPGQVTMTLRDPRIHQEQLFRLYRAPNAKNRPESLALQVLEEIMSGNASTRLYKSLVVEQKIATAASLGYQGAARDLGSITVSLIPAKGASMEKLGAAFDAEIAKLVNGGVGEKELAEAKMRMKDSADYARDSLSGPARTVGTALAVGLTLDDVEYWPYNIDTVTADQVKQAAVKYLLTDATHRPDFVTGYVLLPEKPAPAKEAKP